MTDLSQFDLNLLRVFDAVVRERHVTRAAARLHLSQPAVSNALNRLRAALGDELFLRAPEGVEPTALALALAQPVVEMLDRLRGALVAQLPFVPGTAERVFPVGMSEYAEAVLVPPLLERMARDAPGCLLTVRHADRTNAQALLEPGEAQIAVGVLPEPPSLYTRLRLLPEEFLVLLRHDHPLCESEITPERFAGFPHLLHSPNGSRDGALDAPMREAGHPRRLGAVVAHLSAVPEILGRTEMVMSLSARLARTLAGAHGLTLRPVPVPTTHTRLSAGVPQAVRGGRGSRLAATHAARGGAEPRVVPRGSGLNAGTAEEGQRCRFGSGKPPGTTPLSAWAQFLRARPYG